MALFESKEAKAVRRQVTIRQGKRKVKDYVGKCQSMACLSYELLTGKVPFRVDISTPRHKGLQPEQPEVEVVREKPPVKSVPVEKKPVREDPPAKSEQVITDERERESVGKNS